MKAPKELCKEDKRLWTNLFANLETDKVIEVEMAKRYLTWFNLFNREKPIVEEEGTVVELADGRTAQSKHVQAMKDAENEMRRLWVQLSPVMTKATKTDERLGQFKDL
jgi:hypothetical protein